MISDFHAHITYGLFPIVQTPPVWTDSAKGPGESSSNPTSAMKRRRKSFGADSPEVVTTGQWLLSTILHPVPSSDICVDIIVTNTQTRFDRTGKQSWQPSVQPWLDEQTDELSCAKSAIV